MAINSSHVNGNGEIYVNGVFINDQYVSLDPHTMLACKCPPHYYGDKCQNSRYHGLVNNFHYTVNNNSGENKNTRMFISLISKCYLQLIWQYKYGALKLNVLFHWYNIKATPVILTSSLNILDIIDCPMCF